MIDAVVELREMLDEAQSPSDVGDALETFAHALGTFALLAQDFSDDIANELSDYMDACANADGSEDAEDYTNNLKDVIEDFLADHSNCWN